MFLQSLMVPHRMKNYERPRSHPSPAFPSLPVSSFFLLLLHFSSFYFLLLPLTSFYFCFPPFTSSHFLFPPFTSVFLLFLPFSSFYFLVLPLSCPGRSSTSRDLLRGQRRSEAASTASRLIGRRSACSPPVLRLFSACSPPVLHLFCTCSPPLMGDREAAAKAPPPHNEADP